VIDDSSHLVVGVLVVIPIDAHILEKMLVPSSTSRPQWIGDGGG
jgi:hypothetical protein